MQFLAVENHTVTWRTAPPGAPAKPAQAAIVAPSRCLREEGAEFIAKSSRKDLWQRDTLAEGAGIPRSARATEAIQTADRSSFSEA
jgi:hypothetical protein